MEVAGRIFELMEVNGVTATEVSSATGIKTPTITQWKKGLQEPSTKAVVKIADYLGVSTDYLLKGEEPYRQLSNKKERMTMNNNKKDALNAILNGFSILMINRLGLNDEFEKSGAIKYVSDDEIFHVVKNINELPEFYRKHDMLEPNLQMLAIAKKALDEFEDSLVSPLHSKTLEILNRFGETDQLRLMAELSDAADKLSSKLKDVSGQN
jgi:transcriptional regulator with XRE-family HTH domain